MEEQPKVEENTVAEFPQPPQRRRRVKPKRQAAEKTIKISREGLVIAGVAIVAIIGLAIMFQKVMTIPSDAQVSQLPVAAPAVTQLAQEAPMASQDLPAGVLSSAEVMAQMAKLNGQKIVVQMTANRVFIPASGSVAFIEEASHSFTLLIFKASFQAFGGQDAIQAYEGKNLRVTCQLTIYAKDGTPECILIGPTQIQLIP